MRRRHAAALLALVCGALLCFSWFSTVRRSREEILLFQQQMKALNEHLYRAEERYVQRTRDLKLLLSKVRTFNNRSFQRTNGNAKWQHLSVAERRRTVVSNMTGLDVLHIPSLYNYLPHLQGRHEGLTPAVEVSTRRAKVKRADQTYLVDTLNSLIHELSHEEREDCIIMVSIGETNVSFVNTMVENLQNRFGLEMDSGLLEIISPPEMYYPDFTKLRETFGDAWEKVRWRTKQNLDYCFLMLHAQAKGTYYVQLEDDIVALPNFLSLMKNFAEHQPSEDWMVLEFSQLGFIGKLFKSSDLNIIVEFVLMFYKDKPIDWLLDHILWVKVCNPEKDSKHCERQKGNLRIRFKPSLFQHVGKYSSLSGKVHKLMDRDFGSPPLQSVNVNPPAEVSTSLKVYKQYGLPKAYLAEDFFWALTPKADDYIMFTFLQPESLKRYYFRSGNAEHPGDKLYNTTVEVFLPLGKNIGKEALKDGRNINSKSKQTEDGYLHIGMFKNGIAEGTIDPLLGNIASMRLHVLMDSPVWVILSEIRIERESTSHLT
uniref:alpha-1,3-mannosyl-glycoprotein 4-beta-N-acetylglucosaminyltransferase B-like isoform X2 n=1 Tax=Myxine glutinosa TaxID=7769 RepID=UPI00358FF980